MHSVRHGAANPKNASLGDLQAALRASNRETNRHGMVVIMLLTGSPREQVVRALGLSERRRNTIVMDNAPWHKRKSLNRHFFGSFYLPLPPASTPSNASGSL